MDQDGLLIVRGLLLYFLEKEKELILTTFLALALEIPLDVAVLVTRPTPWLFKHRANGHLDF